MRLLRYLLIALAAVFFLLGILGFPPFDNWSLNSLILASTFIVVIFLHFEAQGGGSREIAALGVLAALGAAGRVIFAAIPGLQPATFVAILAGYVMGMQTGFMAGALMALLSNFFLGQGPWTPWQMLAWGLSGASGGLLGKLFKEKVMVAPTVVMAFFWGYLFGWIMNLWFWLSFVRPLSFKTFISACLASIWFDSLHAIGNLFFAAFLTRPAATMLMRFRKRFQCVYIGGEEG